MASSFVYIGLSEYEHWRVILISLAVQLLILTDVKNIAYSELKFDAGLFPAHDLPACLPACSAL
jgi:hypothetical protein